MSRPWRRANVTAPPACSRGEWPDSASGLARSSRLSPSTMTTSSVTVMRRTKGHLRPPALNFPYFTAGAGIRAAFEGAEWKQIGVARRGGSGGIDATGRGLSE